MTHFIYATDFDTQLRKRLRISGILLIVIGAIGILLPQAVSVVLSVLIASLLIVSGLVVAWSTWYSYRASWLAWLKPFILVLLGLLIALHPAVVAAVLGLLLLIYFLLDGFASVSLALDMRPLSGWGWLLFNGIVSLVLGVVFLVGWPFSSVWLVGVLVGISLMFDGVALLALAAGGQRV
ncbi:MAG TPA: hypothetical protein ENJ80_10585 [Gammaproteobacteria bacterium]|nr:hypothetical protein [Gammaproteobacteria bacterium]